MDPISQGAVGALAAQASARTKHITKITLIGCLAGLAPDLDVLIQSPEDPIPVSYTHLTLPTILLV